MASVLTALPYALIVGGLLFLAFYSSPTLRSYRLGREHSRRMRRIRPRLRRLRAVRDEATPLKNLAA